MKITDKMRLDFIGRRGHRLMTWEMPAGFLVKVLSVDHTGKTLRQAIDAAIRSERSARKGGGNGRNP